MRATLESSLKRGSFDRNSSRQEFENFKTIFCFVCELEGSGNHPSTSFKKLWVGGGSGWVSCDYNVSSAPFVSELRL